MQNENILGIELGSTRIKAVILDGNNHPVASGAYDWENKLVNGVWTYSMEEVKTGLQACYRELKKDYFLRFGEKPYTFGGIGISGMMHGYLVFDNDKNLLTDFRTWRNTITAEAAEKLSKLLDFNIPQRWSISHLYQCVLNKEEHLNRLGYLTTLSGYIHWLLTDERCVGLGEASGMFPVDPATLDYDSERIKKVDVLFSEAGYSWKFRDIFPKALAAGECGGYLTNDGALFLDPEGDLRPGIMTAPPEGDAGTGMVATNSVRLHTGNVSAGTSAFAMVVVDKNPKPRLGIDMVTTPAGLPVAMVHSNTCTTDINAWVNIFDEFSSLCGNKLSKNELFSALFKKALEGDPDGGGLMAFNCFSGEDAIGLAEGRPLFMRTPGASFTLANFMRANLMSSLATLKIGLDMLSEDGELKVSRITGHGGFFKTPAVGQKILSAAFGAPVSVLETAGEGGPYGMALLASYMARRKNGEPLEDFLDSVFEGEKSSTICATDDEIRGFDLYTEKYKKAIRVEQEAVISF